MTTQQADPLRAAGVELTPEVIAKNRWYAFWDAPLFIPEPPPQSAGAKPATSRVLGGPRTASEIRRSKASFSSTSCTVSTDGLSLEVTFPGLSMGIFTGDLRFTVVSRHEPDSDGCRCQHERRVGCVQIRRGSEWIFHSADATRDLARYGWPSAAVSVRWCEERDDRAGEGGEPTAGGRSQGRFACGLHAAAYVLFHPRGRHEPWLRLVPQRRRDAVRHRHSSGRG